MARAVRVLTVLAVVDACGWAGVCGQSAARFAVGAEEAETLFADDFETDQGWTVEGGDNGSGRWSRVIPVGTSAQPGADYSSDPGRYCYVTGQHFGGHDGTNDVDAATVILTSPEIDLPCDDIDVTYARWFHWAGNGVEDFLTIEFSRDGGVNWTTAEVVSGITGWVKAGFRLSDFPAVGGPTLLVRFWSVDPDALSLTEAALDEFRVTANCSHLRGDANDDGVVDLLDYRMVSDCWSGPAVDEMDPSCRPVDLDGNGRVELDDYAEFQALFGATR